MTSPAGVGCIYRRRWEGLKPNEACVIPSIVGDISVIPEIFIAQGKTRGKREAQRERERKLQPEGTNFAYQRVNKSLSVRAYVTVWLVYTHINVYMSVYLCEQRLNCNKQMSSKAGKETRVIYLSKYVKTAAFSPPPSLPA